MSIANSFPAGGGGVDIQVTRLIGAVALPYQIDGYGKIVNHDSIFDATASTTSAGTPFIISRASAHEGSFYCFKKLKMSVIVYSSLSGGTSNTQVVEFEPGKAYCISIGARTQKSGSIYVNSLAIRYRNTFGPIINKLNFDGTLLNVNYAAPAESTLAGSLFKIFEA